MEEKIYDETISLLIPLLICIGIGFLIGLERQFSKEVKENVDQFAGLRTFTMICLMGFLSAFLSQKYGPWFIGVAFSGLFIFIIVSYIQSVRKEDNYGGTSEITTLITFLLGVLVFHQYILLALILMVVLLLLLVFKPGLHGFVKKLKPEELHAVILFVIMSALVIPFLPDENFGPYDLWNLKEIWKMVILVSGTSLVGYMIAKILGNKGTMWAGIIGGLISSTSVSLAFSRRSKTAQQGASFFYAIGIIGACTIMFPRILFEVYVVNRALAEKLWLPIGLILLAGIAAGFFMFKTSSGKADNEELPLKNPLDLKTAIQFALLFAGIQWLVHISNERFGDSGTYIAGAISGITDVDAITLSMAKRSLGADTDVAINTILIAALANTLVKFMIVVLLGSKELRKNVIPGFAALFATGLAYLLIRIL